MRGFVVVGTAVTRCLGTHGPKIAGGRAVAVLVLSLVGCGQTHLMPEDACPTFIGATARCGTYRVGDFGGTTMSEDIERCTAMVAALGEACQNTLSDLALCADGTCGSGCSSLAQRFATECAPAP